MMAHKQLLHDLLKEDQEPFRLQSYIADKRSQLKKPLSSSALQLRKRKPTLAESATKRSNFTRHACFFSFQNSPDVRKSPFRDFPISPAKSPCKSPNRRGFLQIPSGTAAHLIEAAMRIQKPHQSKPKSQNLRFGLFGSFLKRLKDRSKSRRRGIQNNDFGVLRKKREPAAEEPARISTCSNRRVSSADWTDNNEDKSMDFEASTSGYGSDCSGDITSDFDFPEPRFCASPFVFSFHKSPSSNGCRTPDFRSPAPSPSRSTKKEKDNCESRNSDAALVQENEEKERCSPVSVLDLPFEDDEGHESGEAEEDDYHLECSYANVQRAKEQLLHRLRRFEKLAELDPLELEKKLLGGSDDEGSEDLESYSLYRHPAVQTLVSEAFIQSSLQCYPKKMSSDMKKLALDPLVEETCDINCSDSQEKSSEFSAIEMMIGVELKDEDGWIKFTELVDETAAEIALAIFVMLVEEVSEEFIY